MGKKLVKSKSDMIPKAHWAIIKFKKQSVYIEADERSRSCPGHGYPAHTDVFESFEYMAYYDQEEWKSDLAKLMQENPKRDDVLALDVAKVVQPRIMVDVD